VFDWWIRRGPLIGRRRNADHGKYTGDTALDHALAYDHSAAAGTLSERTHGAIERRALLAGASITTRSGAERVPK